MATERDQILSLLHEVPDPEIPVLSIMDLGIVRDVICRSGETEVVITPTYSGCPAMDVISMQIKMLLASHRYKNIKITNSLAPAWTTDWMSEAGKQKLQAYGIAPPIRRFAQGDTLFADSDPVPCPQCGSQNTEQISAFGSTACKALYRCRNCQEPFDYFKCH